MLALFKRIQLIKEWLHLPSLHKKNMAIVFVKFLSTLLQHICQSEFTNLSLFNAWKNISRHLRGLKPYESTCISVVLKKTRKNAKFDFRCRCSLTVCRNREYSLLFEQWLISSLQMHYVPFNSLAQVKQKSKTCPVSSYAVNFSRCPRKHVRSEWICFATKPLT